LVNQNDAPWGLVRVSQRNLNLTRPFSYPINSGIGVTAWVVDTGLDANPAEFGNRARFEKSFDPNYVHGTSPLDGNGHGTHVAGTIGSLTYGVAKNVTVRGLQVCTAEGLCSYSWILSAIQHVVDVHKASGSSRVRHVINMSLGGGASASIDAAVKSATDAGVAVVVAAGNDGGDACLNSPARAPSALTVAASQNNDYLATYSSRGKCVDLIAPGTSIKSTWPGRQTMIISGTSMATPHVTGAVAIALARKTFTRVADLNTFMINQSTKGKVLGPISLTNSKTPNRMVYTLFAV
jgi:subtilisin family serine protease